LNPGVAPSAKIKSDTSQKYYDVLLMTYSSDPATRDHETPAAAPMTGGTFARFTFSL
jgi:hypothetical protein